MTDPACVGGRFDIRLDSARPLLRVVGRMISLRSRLTRVATGDQAIFVRRDVFERLGGFPEIPIMEDVAFCRSLKKQGRIACLRSRVVELGPAVGTARPGSDHPAHVGLETALPGRRGAGHPEAALQRGPVVSLARTTTNFDRFEGFVFMLGWRSP